MPTQVGNHDLDAAEGGFFIGSSHFAILFRIPVMVGLDPTNSGQWGTAKKTSQFQRASNRQSRSGQTPTMTMKR